MAGHRVLICSNVYPPHFVGGAELVAHQYARGLLRLGHRVLVFAGDTQGRRRRHTVWREAHEGVPVVRVSLGEQDFNPAFATFSHPDLDREFLAVVDEFRPTAVHAHNLNGLSAGVLLAARSRGLPTVLTLHDHWGFCLRNTLIKRPGEICRDYRRCADCLPFISDGADRRLPVRLRNDFVATALGAADLLVSPSRYLAERYVEAGFAPERIVTIPYGIDVARFAHLRARPTPDRPRFTFVGFFGEHKGLSVVAEALNHLEPLKGRFHVALVGEGELLEPLRRHVREGGWERWVSLPGKIDNARIDGVYAETDVLLLPSIWPENHPVTITEAMVSGIPVIASRIGGIPEMVEEGVTGFLAEPGDPRHLAAQMARFIENPDLARALGATAAERMADNTVERRLAEYLARYGAASSASGPDTRSRPLVVCLGTRFSPECASAMEAIARTEIEPRFVMREWIDDGVLDQAALAWAVDATVDVRDVAAMAGAGLPLLVPAAAPELRRLCVTANCGLYYADADEAAACLAFLLTNGSARETLARNAALEATATGRGRAAPGFR